MSTTPNQRPEPSLWWSLGYGVILGVVGVVAGLVFIGVTDLGFDWYGETGYGWFDGHWWWLPVAAFAGLVVGLLRRVMKVPAELPGLIEDLEDQRVERRHTLPVVAVSAVSLLGGASLGPEAALGQIGGAAGGWLAERRNLDDDHRASLTLSGMAGAFGGLFSSPLVTLMLIMEIARPVGRRFKQTFYGSLASSSVSFALYFTIAGSLFLGIYEVPSYEFERWHLLAGVGFGVAAAFVAILTGIVTTVFGRAFERPWGVDLAKPVVGALIFGLIGVALPLTNFTGSEQLGSVLDNAGSLGLGLLVAIFFGKMLAFGASAASGFIGGPIFPILFLGGTAGVIINELIPGLPLGLAFTCMLAAVPGSSVSAPFTMVLLAALFTQVGALQTAPILIAVGIAYLVVVGVRRLLASRSAAGSPIPTAGDL